MISGSWHESGWWFRISEGYGLQMVDHRKMPPLFSERNGYTKVSHIGPWCFRILRPNDWKRSVR